MTEQTIPCYIMEDILNFCSNGLLILDEDHRIFKINRFGAQIFGYDSEELEGKDMSILISMSAEEHKAMVDKFREGHKTYVTFDLSERRTIVAKHKNGNDIRLSIRISKLDNGFSMASFDYYYSESSLDPLTGAFLRSVFLSEAKLVQDDYSILFIDLDKFKSVNDTYGHRYGDEVLSVISKRIQNALRKSDMLCRWGGDEFVILLKNTVDENIINRISGKIFNSIHDQIFIKKNTVTVGCSLGYALSDEGNTLNDIVHIADQRMYKHKVLQKNENTP